MPDDVAELVDRPVTVSRVPATPSATGVVVVGLWQGLLWRLGVVRRWLGVVGEVATTPATTSATSSAIWTRRRMEVAAATRARGCVGRHVGVKHLGLSRLDPLLGGQ